MTPFESDIADQPDALRAFLAGAEPDGLAAALTRGHDRIILTGMGSSHYAALPTWRRIVATGRPAWWVDSGQLLDSPQLVTGDSLLVMTSQSGASGEVVALLDECRPATLIGVTNDTDSPLARSADVVVALRSGAEATVSTKSYLNTLAAHQVLADAMTSTPPVMGLDTVTAVERFVVPGFFGDVAESIADRDGRLVYVGFADHAATALYAGLITKEGAKIPADGYIGGQFRHGPLELAGPRLTAVLFNGDTENASLSQLAADLLATGSTVITVGAAKPLGHHIPGPAGVLSQLAHGALVAQHLTVAVARARSIVPGAFAYGSKITASL
ncbi:SIS domain-containing protein [Mycolicibacterium brisbanense]|uniref:Glutamine--fructose-6-phosphate aminotransferase [isomerizing] n=1 Tax=Mycolicibacterium brisbanense TaxID=146020 RepID=A0A100W0Y9_9MYCO|nr:SIS domain-containing protein [Mycolicibacterium brisbanense]MCV7156919.1 SIS domain-containing protein [Mycolicibacterium brisbanense]GAS89637.1 putative phosphosugar isomerase [Mycolicibacterium brisbanense]